MVKVWQRSNIACERKDAFFNFGIFQVVQRH